MARTRVTDLVLQIVQAPFYGLGLAVAYGRDRALPRLPPYRFSILRGTASGPDGPKLAGAP